jgi:hypothetical protein
MSALEAAVTEAIVDLSEIAVTLAERVGQRPAGRVLDIAVKLRKAMEVTEAAAVEPTAEPALFDAPRQIPPGATFMVRRTDGGGFGMEEEFEGLMVDDPDDWSAAREHAEGQAEPVELEMVMLTPTVLGKRTFGRGSLRGEGAA